MLHGVDPSSEEIVFHVASSDIAHISVPRSGKIDKASTLEEEPVLLSYVRVQYIHSTLTLAALDVKGNTASIKHDTGSYVDIISRYGTLRRKHKPEAKKASIKKYTYSGDRLPVSSKCALEEKAWNQRCDLTHFILRLAFPHLLR